MTVSLSPNLLKTMVDWVDLHIGLKVSDARINDFAKGICLAAADSGFDEPQDYINELVRGTPKEHELGFLASYLTVGETYFFRDALSFNLLTTRVLPGLLQRGEPIKIWSAGCATGEEPYSIAITLLSALNEDERRRLEILATDINPRYLEVAKAGVYRRWSFRDVPAFIKDKYFNLSPDDRYRLSDRVKDLVRFSNLNLASDGYPSAITGTNDVDVIFCRNVLIYFSPEHVTEVLARFHRCLKDGGYLFLAPSEIPHPAPDNFRVINMDGAILLRKEGPVPVESNNVVRIVQSNFAYFGGAAQPTMKSFESLIELVDGSTKNELPEDLSADVRLNLGLTEFANDMTAEQIAAEEHYHLDVEDDSIEGVFEEAVRMYEKGQYEEVIDLILELPAIQEDSALENPYILLVRAYANIGNLDAALDWSERLINHQPVNARWYYLRATIQQELGEDGAATISLRQAIFLEPDFVLAHFALGNIHRQSGDHPQATRCFNRVVELLNSVESLSEIQDSDGLMAGQLMTIVKSLMDGGYGSVS